jgi:hypothetical protein
MNTNYNDALREVATQSPPDVAIIDTVSFYHPIAGYYNIVNDRKDFIGNITVFTSVNYKASSFAFSLPDSSSDGAQNLKITVPNTNNEASNYLSDIPVNHQTPIQIIYRMYLSNSPSPVNNPPTLMYIRDIQIDVFTVSAVAVFKSVVNKKYPSEYYTLERFPSLGN